MGSLRKLVREVLLTELDAGDPCPLCGQPITYVGFNGAECSNNQCPNSPSYTKYPRFMTGAGNVIDWDDFCDWIGNFRGNFPNQHTFGKWICYQRLFAANPRCARTVSPKPGVPSTNLSTIPQYDPQDKVFEVYSVHSPSDVIIFHFAENDSMSTYMVYVNDDWYIPQ